MKLSFIGNGAMAKAMIKGAIANYKIEVIGRDLEKLNILNEELNGKLEVKKLEQKIDVEGKVLILCVKPQALKSVATFFKGRAKALISVLAGTNLSSLKEQIKADFTIRAMPNLAASYKASMTTLTGDKGFKEESMLILQSIGKTLWLESEKELDIAAGVNGCGPAFLAIVAEALADGAVKEGVKREDAYALVKGLFEGFAPLLEDSTHPALIKDGVMSPGGVTAAGVGALEEFRVRNAFIKAIQYAHEKKIK